MEITKKTQAKINQKEAAELYKNGATSTELAIKYNTSHQCVLKALRKMGVEIRSPRRGSIAKRDGDIIEKILTAYSAGIPYSEIAINLGIGRGSVYRTLKANGVKPRPQGLRAPTIKVPSDPYVLGYIAGMLDGEGNLQMRTKHNATSISCKMSIYSTTAEVMDWLSENIGGHVRWDHKRTERHGWLPIGIWEIYRAQDVALLLKTLLPLLIIKREAAKKALEMFTERFGFS